MNSSLDHNPQTHWKFTHSLTHPLANDVESLWSARISERARMSEAPFDYESGVLSREGNIIVNHKVYTQKSYKYPLIKMVSDGGVGVSSEKFAGTTGATNATGAEKFSAISSDKFTEKFAEKFRSGSTGVTVEKFTEKCENSSDASTIEKFAGKKISFVEYIDDTYLKALEARALMLCRFLQTNSKYSAYSENWKLLEKNLNKKGCLFEKLDNTDEDIAYVVNKGDDVKFRIHDKDRYMPINIYQYVVFHEMAHMSTTELQHTKHFQELLSIICLAAFECGLIDLKRIKGDPSVYYKTNSQPIISKNMYVQEITDGIRLIGDGSEYFRKLEEYLGGV